jgi:hypothetical protein
VSDKERREVMHRVMKAMRHESARASVRASDDHGVRPIVIGLPSDTVESTAARVDATGGSATVIVPHGETLMALGWTRSASDSGDVDCIAAEQIHPDSELCMLVTYLAKLDGQVLHFHISSEWGSVDVTDRDELMVPA